MIARPPARYSRPSRRIMRRARNSISWLRAAVALAVQTGDAAISFSPRTEIVLTNGASVKHAYPSTRAFVTACYSAVQGEGDKIFGAADTNDLALTAAGLPLTADIFTGVAAATFGGGTQCFGWHVRLSGSITNWPYRMVRVDIGKLTGAAGPVQTLDAAQIVASYQIISYSPVVDLFFPSVGNAGGQMTIKPGLSGNGSGVANIAQFNGMAIRIVDATTFGNFETLNARDFISRLSPGVRRHDDALEELLDVDDDEAVDAYRSDELNDSFGANQALRDS
jgi:hypothetical protein